MSNRPLHRRVDATWRQEHLREGYTTGACAAAAAAAATRALITGQPVRQITIDLPAKKNVVFALARCEFDTGRVTCGTIKDAGDDPDVTNGIEVQATVAWSKRAGVHIAGGAGVGIVTLPGLPVEVGRAAINPAPHRQIEQAVRTVVTACAADERLTRQGLQVVIGVPGGEALAAQTMNPRLGIVGGISILGTTGIVRPYSEPAYRASIHVELSVAIQNGVTRAILTTGRRSETYALAHDPTWSELGCVQVGDHMDYALRQAARLGFRQAVIAGMIGKLSKLAQGRMQTHVSRGGVDFDFLAGLVARLGAAPELVAQARTVKTARHIQVLLRRAEIKGLEAEIARLAAAQAFAFVRGALSISVLLFDIRGALLAQAEKKC